MVSIFSIQLTSQHFSMHYTDQFSGQWDRHCLSYTVLDDIYSSPDTPLFQHQNILYCFRSSEPPRDNGETITAIDSQLSIVSFKQLKMMHISADHLFHWSAPMDLIERYAAYLQGYSHTQDDHPLFYNCTTGWFGPEPETRQIFPESLRLASGASHIASLRLVLKAQLLNRLASLRELVPSPRFASPRKIDSNKMVSRIYIRTFQI